MEEALEGFDGGIKIGETKLNNLRFADDIDLIEEDPNKLQHLIDRVNVISKKYDMKINAKKNETMLFCRKEEENLMAAKLEDQELKNVEYFKYLGAKFTYNNDCSVEIKNRID